MSRYPRYVPHSGALVEITYRTVQGRFLLRPDSELNELVVGVLARAPGGRHLGRFGPDNS